MTGAVILWIFLLIGSVDGHEGLDSLVQEFTEWRLRDNPEYASNIGDQRYTEGLEEYSLEALETRKNEIAALKQHVEDLPRDSLPREMRVTYDVMKDMIDTWLAGYEWRYYGPMNPISFLDGIQTSYRSKAGQVKFTSEESFRKFAKRIRKFGDRVDQVIERMTKAIEMGTTHHNNSMTRVPDQLDGILGYKDNATNFAFYVPFTEALSNMNGIPEENKTEIRSEALDNIDYFIEQIDKLKTFIVDQYMPNTRRDFGVYSLTRGKEYYQACLKWHLSVDLTPDEIHKKGLEEVKKIHDKMMTILKRNNFTGDVKKYMDEIKADDSNYFQTDDEILNYYREILKNRIKPKLPRYFKDLKGDDEVRIQPMTYDGPSAIYKNGAPDGSRPGVFFVNVMSPKNNPKYNAIALTLHEADPGHHLQDAYALTSQSIPDFRKTTDFSKYFSTPLHFPFYTAYSEGWALYCEDFDEELEIAKDDRERMGKYGSEIFRAARLVVDTGIHAKGWTKERAVGYMLNYTAYSEEFIAKEMDRYSTWPGQATSYTIGKLKVRELKNKAAVALCNYFDIKEFHETLLENGAMPLGVMETVVDDWIMSVKKELGFEPCRTSSGVLVWPNIGLTVTLATISYVW